MAQDECGAAATRGDGVRRRHRRCGSGGPGRSHPPEAAGGGCRQRGVRRRAGKGLGGRRAHPVGRRDRSDRPGRAVSRLEGQGRAAGDAGARGSLLLPRPRRRAAHPQPRHAAADEQSRQLHRQPRQSDQVAGRAGGRAGRRGLSGLCRRRGALRRQGRGAGRCHRRHGHRQGRPADRPFHPRHGAARQVHHHRRGRARLAGQAAAGQVRAGAGPPAAEIRHRPQGAVGGAAGEAPPGPRAAYAGLAAR